jgi:hypothetical protein
LSVISEWSVTSSKVLAGLAFCEFFIPRFSYLRMEAIFNTAGTPLKFYIILRAGMMGFLLSAGFGDQLNTVSTFSFVMAKPS